MSKKNLKLTTNRRLCDMKLVSMSPMKIREDGRYQYSHPLTPEMLLNPIWDYFVKKENIVSMVVEGTDFRQTTNPLKLFDKFNAGYRVDYITVSNDFVGEDLREVLYVKVHMTKGDFEYNEVDSNVVMKLIDLAGGLESENEEGV